jgi:hypothetical protein
MNPHMSNNVSIIGRPVADGGDVMRLAIDGENRIVHEFSLSIEGTRPVVVAVRTCARFDDLEHEAFWVTQLTANSIVKVDGSLDRHADACFVRARRIVNLDPSDTRFVLDAFPR